MNHIDKSVARSLAIEHSTLHLQGAYTVCPYKPGTKEREVYDNQWKRMMDLAGEKK